MNYEQESEGGEEAQGEEKYYEGEEGESNYEEGMEKGNNSVIENNVENEQN